MAPRSVALEVGRRTWLFVSRAGPVIVVLSVVLWGLSSFPRDVPLGRDYAALKAAAATPGEAAAVDRLQKGERIEKSYAGTLGRLMEPAIRPLGFDCKIGIGLVASFAAREVFVSTMGIVYAAGSDEENTGDRDAMKADRDPVTGKPVFRPLVGLSLLVFFVLAMQCMSTPETTVTKTAVATLTCGSRARTLPLAVGDCQFEGFDGPEDCDDLPSLTQQNVHVDDSCWTSLSTTDPANANDISDYISAICGLEGTTPPPPVSEGQDIRVAEGGMASVCQTVRDCFDAGVTEFIVPVVACEGASATTVCAAKGSGSLTINGFARIVLSARPACTGSPKTIPLQAFCNTDPTDGVGGNCDFGNFKVAMVE